MAFNNGFPVNYQQYYQQPQQNMQNMQQMQIQNGGFVPVTSEEMARNYPVAQGTSVTFRDENAPYIYTKTMGFSQLDRPIFEKYKLVREETPAESKGCTCSSDVECLKGEINKLWEEIRRLEHEQQSFSNVSADETKSDAVVESEV